MGNYVKTGKPPGGFKPGYVPTAEHRAALGEAARYRAAHGYRKVIVRGVRYDNITQAAKAVKMSVRCMREYLASDKPHHHEYQYAPEQP